MNGKDVMTGLLEGELVRLRAREQEDEPFAYGWANDPDVTRWLGARYPWSRSMAADKIRESTLGPNSCVFSIDASVGERPIGWVALRSDGIENRSASLGIAVGDKEFWNGGYGADAMRVVCRFGFGMMNLNRIHLDVFPENERAIRCYEKVGFVIEGRTRDAILKHGGYHDLILMSVLVGELK